MTRLTPMVERFWPKVDKSGNCWLWTAGKNKDGYGQIGRGNGTQGNMLGAHRVSYEMENGPIPAGMVIDHICHQRSCVRPSHLRAVTQKQNMENRRGPISATGVRGVYRVTNSPSFQVTVGHNGKLHYGGVHATIAEAEAVAIALRNRLHTCNDLDRSAAA